MIADISLFAEDLPWASLCCMAMAWLKELCRLGRHFSSFRERRRRKVIWESMVPVRCRVICFANMPQKRRRDCLLRPRAPRLHLHAEENSLRGENDACHEWGCETAHGGPGMTTEQRCHDPELADARLSLCHQKDDSSHVSPTSISRLLSLPETACC